RHSHLPPRIGALPPALSPAWGERSRGLAAPARQSTGSPYNRTIGGGREKREQQLRGDRDQLHDQASPQGVERAPRRPGSGIAWPRRAPAKRIAKVPAASDDHAHYADLERRKARLRRKQPEGQ